MSKIVAIKNNRRQPAETIGDQLYQMQIEFGVIVESLGKISNIMRGLAVNAGCETYKPSQAGK